MEVHLKIFGDLRKKVNPKISGTLPITLDINDGNITKVIDIFNKYDMKEEEVSHIFVNGSYSGPKKSLNNGDLVALFPRNMALLYKWYFNKDED